MNKQEAIETIEQDKIQVGRFTEITREGNASHRKIEMVDYVPLEIVVSVIDKINEPKKVVVPKFVAEWIEWCKTNDVTLLGAISPIDELGSAICNDKRVKSLAASRWAILNQDTSARAWLDGYEVEKEKLYTVEIPNPNLNAHVVLQKTEKGVVLVTVGNARWKGWESSKLTEAEIKKDFERLWWYAKEVEDDTD